MGDDRSILLKAGISLSHPPIFGNKRIKAGAFLVEKNRAPVPTGIVVVL
jgi:hypothetical protein